MVIWYLRFSNKYNRLKGIFKLSQKKALGKVSERTQTTFLVELTCNKVGASKSETGYFECTPQKLWNILIFFLSSHARIERFILAKILFMETFDFQKVTRFSSSF